MSKENVRKFFEEVAKNEDFQKQLKSTTEKSSAEVQKAVEAQIAIIVAFAKKAGFDFTVEELLAQSTQPDGKKLDQNELDAVAGGRWIGFTCCDYVGMGVGCGCDTGGSYCALIGGGRGCSGGGMS